MELVLQIESILMSFGYGIVFFILVSVNYKFLYCKGLVLKIIINILFILFNVILYFMLLRLVNDGVVHIYFLFSILGGYLLAKWLGGKIKG
mgnify:FL=1